MLNHTKGRGAPLVTVGPPIAGLFAGLLAALLTVTAAAPAAAQRQSAACDESAGTLGIQGMRCEGCTFAMSESGIDQARFRTEPQILAIARGFTRGDRLRAGDRIVAIDGALITTRSGSARLVDLRAGQRIELRVRRDGEMLTLDVTAGSACELRRRVRDRDAEIEVERMRELPVGYDFVVPAPPAPASPSAPLPDLPSLPETPRTPSVAPVPSMPPAPSLPPSGYLGFGLECSRCGTRDGEFFFSSPPVINGVDEDGPAARAGLESGDVILEIDGLDITGEGAVRFSEIESGDEVAMTVRRGDGRRTVTLTAGSRTYVGMGRLPRAAPTVAPLPTPHMDRLQFEGELGDTRIEVRGGPVTVTRNQETGEIVIRTVGTVIRLTNTGASASSGG